MPTNSLFMKMSLGQDGRARHCRGLPRKEKYMDRTRLLLALVAAAMTVSAGQAVASPPTLETLSLDTHEAGYDGFAGPVGSTVVLAKKTEYVVTVDGTFSPWRKREYTNPGRPWTMVCGTIEAAPLYPSAGANGPVGADAETIFARPWAQRKCDRDGVPATFPEFQIRLKGKYEHVKPAPGAIGHVYQYRLVGRGEAVGFRLKDPWSTNDNYGQLRISLRRADGQDCSNRGWEQFGYDWWHDCWAHMTGGSSAT